MYGQEIHAAVVLKQGKQVKEKELQEYVGKNAAKFKIPKKVQPSPPSPLGPVWESELMIKIYFTKEIPKTATGKVQRAKVSEAFFKPDSAAKAKL
jgi:oxalate---CoA ligase